MTVLKYCISAKMRKEHPSFAYTDCNDIAPYLAIESKDAMLAHWREEHEGQANLNNQRHGYGEALEPFWELVEHPGCWSWYALSSIKKV